MCIYRYASFGQFIDRPTYCYCMWPFAVVVASGRRPATASSGAASTRTYLSPHVLLLYLIVAMIGCQWVETGYSTQWCYENFIQHRSMKRARDIREQVEGLCERVEIEVTSCNNESINIRKVSHINSRRGVFISKHDSAVSVSKIYM